jgi:hypothetical protein
MMIRGKLCKLLPSNHLTAAAAKSGATYVITSLRSSRNDKQLGKLGTETTTEALSLQ